MSTEVTIVAGGPSLRTYDWVSLSGVIIAINNAAFKLPQASYVYFANRDWFERFRSELRTHRGMKIQGVAGEIEDVHCPWVEPWVIDRLEGIPDEPRTLAGGGNSGYAALVLAAKLGFKHIRLLGYDMKSPGHNFHNDHTWTAHEPDQWIPRFGRLADMLADKNIEVVNLGPDSALTYFKKEGQR